VVLVAGEGGAGPVAAVGALDRASATRFFFPLRCWMSEVYSEISMSCLDLLGERGSVDLARACVRGLWSVNTVNCLPSR